jgi:hypothetical protein
MRLTRTWVLIVGLAAVTGCSRQQAAPCEPEARYSTARSAQPVQIPDDLSPPDESDAIRLPAVVAPVASITAGECLETPPPFFGDSRPFLGAEEETRKSRREARREAKRQERAADAAPTAEPDAAPAEQRDPAPADNDRTIDN